MFAPVASHIAERALIDEMRCANIALAASLESSEDHRPTVRIRFSGTQFAYTFARASQAAFPASVWREPMRTRSGDRRSWMAVPSARNSGLERISKRACGLEFASRMVRIDSAVRHGTVDFSTTILLEVATWAIRRVASST